MDTQIAKGSINELKGELKKTWSKLTDDDLTYLEGGTDTIVGKVQKAYGYTKDRAQQEFDSFKRNHSNYFHDGHGSFNQEKRMPTNSNTSSSSSSFNNSSIPSSSNSAQLDPNRIKNKAQQMISEDVMEPAQEYLSRAREFGVKAMERGSEYAKENPGYTVLGAAAVGFLLGALVARRR